MTRQQRHDPLISAGPPPLRLNLSLPSCRRPLLFRHQEVAQWFCIMEMKRCAPSFPPSYISRFRIRVAKTGSIIYTGGLGMLVALPALLVPSTSVTLVAVVLHAFGLPCARHVGEALSRSLTTVCPTWPGGEPLHRLAQLRWEVMYYTPGTLRFTVRASPAPLLRHGNRGPPAIPWD